MIVKIETISNGYMVSVYGNGLLHAQAVSSFSIDGYSEVSFTHDDTYLILVEAESIEFRPNSVSIRTIGR